MYRRIYSINRFLSPTTKLCPTPLYKHLRTAKFNMEYIHIFIAIKKASPDINAMLHSFKHKDNYVCVQASNTYI